jgi:hypothetical protein
MNCAFLPLLEGDVIFEFYTEEVFYITFVLCNEITRLLFWG